MLTVDRASGTAVARLTARRAARSGGLWGVVFGLFVASSAVSYSTIYKTQAERDHLAAAFGANKASSALFGPAPMLQTVAGFTVLKVSMTLMVIGAVWGLLLSTRLLRGEEDAGRWELLCAGRTTPRRATAQVAAGFGAGVVSLYVVTALIVVATGRSSKVGFTAGSSLFFSVVLVCTAAMFLGVGALASQVSATRRQAAASSAVVLGVSYAVRMVADAGIGLHWLVWLSPLGWVEQLQPLIAPSAVPLLPIAGLTVATVAVAVHLAGRRDLGASVIPDRAHPTTRVRLLAGPVGLAVRTLRAVVLGWWTAVAITGVLTGLVAKAAGATISGSSVTDVFRRLGAPGTGAVAFLGVSFLIVAVLVAFVAAGQITAAWSEESEGRLDHLLVRPVSRWTWLGGRLGVAVVVLGMAGALAGVFTWLAAASQHAGVPFATLLEAGVNVVPPAVCLLGIGALALGVWPCAATAVVYGLLGWSLLVELVGGIGALDHWVSDTSLFHQIASAPAVPPNWTVNGVLLAVGVAGAFVGGLAFRRRDLQGA